MTNVFMKLPINAGRIIRQNNLEQCSLGESVSGMLHLIATTQLGETIQDESFGNQLWEHDFENIENIQAFKENLSAELRKTIERHEQRLSNVKVTIDYEQVVSKVVNRRVRQRIQIHIEGTLVKTNEAFTHREEFFMGPLSYY